MMSNSVDSIVEEYWRLEDEGRVLVARQCCLHVSGTQHSTAQRSTAHGGQGVVLMHLPSGIERRQLACQ